jgi:hypothetical protein
MTKKTFISISQNRKQGKGNFKATRSFHLSEHCGRMDSRFLGTKRNMSLLSTRKMCMLYINFQHELLQSLVKPSVKF